VDVPVEFFESVIGTEVAIAGALLFQVRFFEQARASELAAAKIPGPWSRLAMAIVIGVTLFGSLSAIATDGPRIAAISVTVGLAVSALPILYRVVPPITASRSDAAATTVGLLLYAGAVAIMLALLGR
jgi:hypothetical protein